MSCEEHSDESVSILLGLVGERSLDPKAATSLSQNGSGQDGDEHIVQKKYNTPSNYTLQSALEAMKCINITEFIVSTEQKTMLDSLSDWKENCSQFAQLATDVDTHLHRPKTQPARKQQVQNSDKGPGPQQSSELKIGDEALDESFHPEHPDVSFTISSPSSYELIAEDSPEDLIPPSATSMSNHQMTTNTNHDNTVCVSPKSPVRRRHTRSNRCIEVKEHVHSADICRKQAHNNQRAKSRHELFDNDMSEEEEVVVLNKRGHKRDQSSQHDVCSPAKKSCIRDSIPTKDVSKHKNSVNLEFNQNTTSDMDKSNKKNNKHRRTHNVPQFNSSESLADNTAVVQPRQVKQVSHRSVSVQTDVLEKDTAGSEIIPIEVISISDEGEEQEETEQTRDGWLSAKKPPVAKSGTRHYLSNGSSRRAFANRQREEPRLSEGNRLHTGHRNKRPVIEDRTDRFVSPQRQEKDPDMEEGPDSEREPKKYDINTRMTVNFRAWQERMARSENPSQRRLRQLKLTDDLLNKIEENLCRPCT